jgi:hypothetical protein
VQIGPPTLLRDCPNVAASGGPVPLQVYEPGYPDNQSPNASQWAAMWRRRAPCFSRGNRGAAHSVVHRSFAVSASTNGPPKPPTYGGTPLGGPGLWQSIPSLFSSSTATPHIQVSRVLRRTLTWLGCVTICFHCITRMLELHGNLPYQLGEGDFLRESVSLDAKPLRQPCLIANSSLNSVSILGCKFKRPYV